MSDLLRPIRSVVLAIVTVTLVAAPGNIIRADEVTPTGDPAESEPHALLAEGEHGAADAAGGDPDPQGHATGEQTPTDGHAGVEHGDRDYNKPPLEVELPLLMCSLAIFLVFLFVAKKLAWMPLIAGLDAREGRVNRALADAKAARLEVEKLIAEHQAHLDEVTEQIKAIIAQARTDAEGEKTRIIAEAHAETIAMRDEAIAEIHTAREEALSGLDDRIDTQVHTATQHVLG